MEMVAVQGNRVWDALSSVPGHLRAAGKRCPWVSLLLIAVAAILAGRRDQLGIVRWGGAESGDARYHWHPSRPASGPIGLVRIVPGPGCHPAGTRSGRLGERCSTGRRSCGDRRRTAARERHHTIAGCASASGVWRQFAWRHRPVTGDTGGQRDHRRAGAVEDAAAVGGHHHWRRDLHPKGDCQRITDSGGDYFFTVKDNPPAL
jgi:hypothetical protein